MNLARRSAVSPPPPLGRNPQGLTGIDQVGVLEHRPVGLEDPHVGVGVAVELAGDLRQGVAAPHRVEAEFPWACRLSGFSAAAAEEIRIESSTLLTPLTLPMARTTFSFSSWLAASPRIVIVSSWTPTS